jgi:hypothetical protein
MRLVTFTADGRRGVGLRRAEELADTGYDDMHELIADGTAGLERAAAAADVVTGAQLLAPIRPASRSSSPSCQVR